MKIFWSACFFRFLFEEKEASNQSDRSYDSQEFKDPPIHRPIVAHSASPTGGSLFRHPNGESMPLLIPLLVFFLLFASPTLSEPVPFTVLDKEFHNYLRSSESVPLSQKYELWLQLLEKPHDKIYSSYLPQDVDARRKLVLPWLETYQGLGEEIQEFFPVIVRDTKVQLKAFRDKFPALSDSYSVIILPALSFNGKTARVDGQQVLMLGVDQIVKRRDHLGILVSHELFHIYHEQVWGGPRTDAVTLTWPLWVEGLATYASQSFGPQAEIFMDDELAALDDAGNPVAG